MLALQAPAALPPTIATSPASPSCEKVAAMCAPVGKLAGGAQPALLKSVKLQASQPCCCDMGGRFCTLKVTCHAVRKAKFKPATCIRRSSALLLTCAFGGLRASTPLCKMQLCCLISAVLNCSELATDHACLRAKCDELLPASASPQCVSDQGLQGPPVVAGIQGDDMLL